MSSGTQTWSSPADVVPDTFLAFGLGYVFYSNLDGQIHALDYQTGTDVWASGADYIQGDIAKTPVYLMAGNTTTGTLFFTDDTGYLYAVNPSNGALLWMTQVTTNYHHGLSAPVVAPYEANPYCLYLYDDKSLYCVIPQGSTPQVVTVYTTGSTLNPFAAPVFDPGTMRIMLEEGNGVSGLIVGGAECPRLWGPAAVTGTWPAPPVVLNEIVYLCDGNSQLVALFALDGGTAATFQEGWGQVTTPVVVTNSSAGQQIGLGTSTGWVYWLQLANASFTTIWSQQPIEGGGSIVTAPQYENGILYVGGSDESIYGFPIGDPAEAISYSANTTILGIGGVSNGNVYFSVQPTATENGIQAVNFAAVANAFSVQCELIQDFDDTAPAGTVNQLATFHCHVRMVDQNNNPLPGEVVQIEASAPANIIVNATLPAISIGPSAKTNVAADESGNLVIAIPATSTVVNGQSGGLSCPMLTLWGNFMGQPERIVVYPDQPLHDRLASIQGTDLQSAASYPSNTITPGQPASLGGGTSILPSAYQGSDGVANANAVASAINSAMGGQSSAALAATRRAALASSPYIAFPQTTSNGVGYAQAAPTTPRQAPVPAQPWALSFDSEGNATYNEGSNEDMAMAVSAIMARKNIARAEDFLGIGDFIDNCVNGLEKVVSVVVSVVSSVVSTTIEGVEAAYQFTVAAVEDAANMVLGLLKTIASDIESAVDSIIQALSFLFSWSDILATHRAIAGGIRTLLTNLGSNINNTLLATAPGAKTSNVKAFFDGLEGTIDSLFASILDTPAGPTPAGGTPPPTLGSQSFGAAQQPNADPNQAYCSGNTYLSSGSNNSVASTSYTQKAKSNLKSSSASSMALAGGGTLYTGSFASQFESFLGTAASQVSSDLQSAWSNLLTQLEGFFADLATLQSTGITDLIGAVKTVADFFIEVAGNIAEDFLALLGDLASDLLELLTANITIPIISDLYQWITGDSLTILDLFSLLASIPLTIVYKAVTGNAPVSSTAAAVDPIPWQVGQVGFSIGMIIYALIDAFIDYIGQLFAWAELNYASLAASLVVLFCLWGSFDPELFTSGSTHNQVYFALSCVPIALSVWGLGDASLETLNTLNSVYGAAMFIVSIVYAAEWASTWSDPYGMSLLSNLLGTFSPLFKGTGGGPMAPAVDLISGIGCGIANVANWPPWGSANS